LKLAASVTVGRNSSGEDRVDHIGSASLLGLSLNTKKQLSFSPLGGGYSLVNANEFKSISSIFEVLFR
jgi:hypothetical protein